MDEDVRPNLALDSLIGLRVRVWSNSGDSRHTDEGTLEAFDYPWIRLRVDVGEVLCFPVHNVRMVKSLDPLPPDLSDQHTLLRPLD